jgi:hypothetical protein
MSLLSRIAGGAARTARLVLVSAAAALLGLILVQAVAAESPSPGSVATPSASPDASAAPTFGLLPSAQPASPGGQPSEAPAPAPAPAPGESLPAAQQNTCYTCHSAIDNKQHDIAQQWKDSVHGQNSIGCADCHGGDPTSDEVTVAMSTTAGFIGKPARSASVGVCGTCHSNVERMRQYQIPTDQLAKYQASVHGQRLLTAQDTRVAICIDCHGVHDIKKASDPTAAVYPLNVPKLCASCHADVKLMEPYGIPTNQYALYEASVHGKALLVNQDMRAPTCASCHGSHDAKPPQSSEVVGVCGKCHTATQALYAESKHSRLDVGPKCWTCHGTHDVAQPDESRFFHPKPPELDCTTCHNAQDQTLVLNADRFASDQDRRCDTCHHQGSIIYSQAQGIFSSLDRANTAYQAADDRIGEAAGAGMIVSDADVQLSQALTSLIRARAAVHTTKLTSVATLADEAAAKAAEAQAFADTKLQESVFRRQAMVVVLVLILVNVLALLVLRRRIDHDHSSA